MVAAGGFGTIYLAETKQGEQVAVKVLESFENQQQIERFEREFDKLKSIQHERIITCYERGRGRVRRQRKRERW
jgi:serine/threonine protein kinase